MAWLGLTDREAPCSKRERTRQPGTAEQLTELNARSQGTVQWKLHAPARNSRPTELNARSGRCRAVEVARADQDHPPGTANRAERVVE